MGDSSHRVPEPSRWERLVQFSHRFLLPVAGTATATFGGALLVEFRAAAEPYAPYLLIAGGTASVATSFAYLRSRRAPVVVPQRPVPDGRRAAPSAPLAPRLPFAPAAPAPPRPSLAAGYAKSTWWDSALTSASSPADRLWHEWLATGTGGFDVSLVGPVPETFYQPPARGCPSPFESKEPDFIVMDRPSIDFEISEPIGVAGDAWSQGSFSIMDTMADPIACEALNATPPHLRTDLPADAKRVPLWRSPLPPTPAQACTTCTSPLAEARWHPCPKCQSPVCGDCVVDSLWAHGTAWCAECSPAVASTGSALAAS